MSEMLDDKKGKALLKLARGTLAHKLGLAGPPAEPQDPDLRQPAATFVTLKIDSKLRGCIGSLAATGPLWQGIRDNAVNAAFRDQRFSPLKASELERVHLDISILSPPQPLHYDGPEGLLNSLRPGRDGVILRDGNHQATFLPQVWKQLPDPEMFLDHLCLKAGLSRSAWRDRDLEILTYQVQSFAEVDE